MSRKQPRKITSTVTYMLVWSAKSMKPNSLNAVLAVGERRLDGEEVHHLRQSEGDHGEIDALPADRERADDSAEPGGGHGPARDREFRREAPDLGGVSADIARPTEEQGVAERQQADIADQQVERTGKQREAQRLHQEYGIGEHRRHDEGADHQEERHRLALRAPRMRHARFGSAMHVTWPFRTGRPA